ncbi:MAG: response regulator, partial [Desulfobacter sp.]|nr:response regulator [Desulfobacter sp.]
MPVAQNAVLIVDDDPDYRKLLRGRLEQADFTTAEARDGSEAVEILKVESYDVILLDLNMPNMGGYEVLQWIHGNTNTQDINVIVLTADSIRDHVVTTLTLGAKDFITKSAGKLELITRVKRLCQIKTLEGNANNKIADKELLQSTVLLVDDDELSIGLTARRIENAGYKVLRASRGQDALSIVRTKDIKLALLDINMPDISGLEVLNHIRAIKPKEELAIIMVTAIEDPDIVIDCINAGADDYIMKPFHPAELTARINTILRFSLLLN